jgi:4'-phosphopantetheinyl transferase
VTIVATGATEKGCGGLQVVFVDLKASVALLEAAERDVPRLSATDNARVQKLAHDPERQRLWQSSRIATRIVLERALGTAYRNIDFEIAKNGRPSFGDGPPYFNVSHSGGAALIAVSDAVPIGIDLEEARRLKMTEDRRRRVIAAAARLANGQPATSRSDANLNVLRAWVRLEAAAKALGTGIGQLLTEEGVVGGKPADSDRATAASRLDVRNLDVASGYIAAVAAPTLPMKIEVLTLPNDADALTEFLTCART